MSIGSSGRVVLEIDPDLKKELYSSLALDGVNMKQWFLIKADEYLSNRDQLSLELVDNKAKGIKDEI